MKQDNLVALENPELVLRYKADASRQGLLAMLAMAPIWAGWMTWVESWLVRPVFESGVYANMDLFCLALFFLAVQLCAIGTILVCIDNKLTIDAHGVRIPVRFLLHTFGRVQFKWKELRAVLFLKDGAPSEHGNTLRFDYGRFARVDFRLDGFRHDELPKMMLAIQAYAPSTEIFPEAGLRDVSLVSKDNPLTFTRIWESELHNRFGSTIFVPLEPAQTLQNGSLQVAGQIAFGGLSAIYLAKMQNDELALLKEAVVPQNANEAARQKAIEMFQREAQVLTGLDHPRVARVLDHFVENGRHYLLLEYIQGKDLRSYVRENGAVREDVAMRWLHEIAHILAYLHGRTPPIIHRDLTPDNLVLARDGSISLIDFGAANEFMGTATGTLIGKQSYISPEQFRGKACPQSDLYSLGCTLHYVLTGADPEPLSVSHAREIVPVLSEAMDNLIARLTEQELEDRINSAEDLLAELKTLMTKGACLKIHATVHHA